MIKQFYFFIYTLNLVPNLRLTIFEIATDDLIFGRIYLIIPFLNNFHLLMKCNNPIAPKSNPII